MNQRTRGRGIPSAWHSNSTSSSSLTSLSPGGLFWRQYGRATPTGEQSNQQVKHRCEKFKAVPMGSRSPMGRDSFGVVEKHWDPEASWPMISYAQSVYTNSRRDNVKDSGRTICKKLVCKNSTIFHSEVQKVYGEGAVPLPDPSSSGQGEPHPQMLSPWSPLLCFVYFLVLTKRNGLASCVY